LQKGTVDFLVPSTYWAPVPPKRLIHSFLSVDAESESRPRPSVENKSSSFIPVLNSAETATRKPAPMNYVFALDVSLEAIQTGFLNSICEILLDMLYGGSGTETEATSRSWWNPESKLAIVTFDRELCFYDFSVSLLHSLTWKDADPKICGLQPGAQHAAMLVVSDIDEVFSPMPSVSNLFMDPQEGRCVSYSQ
jgi:protein transport protein SEC24